MSSYQVSVESNFNHDQESTSEAIVEKNLESGILKESNAFASEPEGPLAYMDEPLSDNSWNYSREVQEAEQRNQGLQNRFYNISEDWKLGKQLKATISDEIN